MSDQKKPGIISFKVGPSLWEAMRDIPNRSEFIRSAIQGALQGVCPLCRGSGSLTPQQRRHWRRFAEDHAIRECDDCHALYLVCGVVGGPTRGSRGR